MMKNVTLVLSDGTKFHGKSFGYDQPVAGEVLCRTADDTDLSFSR